MSKFQNIFNTIIIDIAFFENLSVQVKYEPQSLHWAPNQIGIHSEY